MLWSKTSRSLLSIFSKVLTCFLCGTIYPQKAPHSTIWCLSLLQFRTISSMNGQKTLSCGRVIILNNKEYGSRFGIILNSKKPYPSDSPIRARKTYNVLIICDATELVWTDSKKALPNSEDIENIVQPYVKDTKVFCPDRPCCHKVIELIESDIAVITKEEMKVKSEAIINDYNKRQQIRFRWVFFDLDVTKTIVSFWGNWKVYFSNGNEVSLIFEPGCFLWCDLRFSWKLDDTVVNPHYSLYHICVICHDIFISSLSYNHRYMLQTTRNLGSQPWPTKKIKTTNLPGIIQSLQTQICSPLSAPSSYVDLFTPCSLRLKVEVEMSKILSREGQSGSRVEKLQTVTILCGIGSAWEFARFAFNDFQKLINNWWGKHKGRS